MRRVRGEDHIDEVTRDESGAVSGAILSWAKAGHRHHKDWDNTILGHLRLEPDRLVAEVNSPRRADRLKREFGKRLKGVILLETQVVDSVEAIADAMTRQQWKAWLDTRVPALDNRRPLQAARSAGGRERLAALLAQFERDAESRRREASADIEFIRDELGLTNPA